MFVSRVILPDSSGVPVLQDLAALREAVQAVRALRSEQGLSPREAEVLRVLAVAELDRNTHRALQRLSGDPTRPGLAVDGIATARRLREA